MSWDEDLDYISVNIETVDIDIKISTISQEKLVEIANNCKVALQEKLKKINVIVKNMKVYQCNNTLLVNDRYSICRELEEIVQSFGMLIKPIDCGLKGKSYLISDMLVGAIQTIISDFEMDNISNAELTNELLDIMKQQAFDMKINQSLSQKLQTIYKVGSYSIVGQKTTVSTYEGRSLISQESTVKSAEQNVVRELQDYLKSTKEYLSRTNEYMRDGTAKLLYTRARQMGYAVEEKRNGEQVQLVLVRCE